MNESLYGPARVARSASFVPLSRRATPLWISSFLLPALFAPRLHAQVQATDAARVEPAPAGADEVQPPVLERFVEARYPAAAREAGVEGGVLLELTISPEGSVSQADVLEGPGHGLNEAAREAALQCRFRPALRGGQPRAARIRYSYDFRLPQAAEAAVAAVAEAGAVAGERAEAPPGGEARAEAEPAADTAAEQPEEVVSVQGERVGDRLRRSAHAVTVVELGRAQKESADIGEVLARTEGVNVQRMGGLGSAARFTLAGFDDNQVRFFIDGIPLEYSGYPFGIQNVPITFAERIDIYKGVVPVRLGADSLGGAFDVITDRTTRGTKGSFSLQGGSFDTYRLAASGRHFDEETGFFGKAEAFYDAADNDYPIDVDVTDASGKLVPTQAHRTHDQYRGVGGNVEAGVVGREWAQRLLVRAFATDYHKDLQHNVSMTKPYGEASAGGFSAGGNVRYEQDFGQGLRGSFVTGYVFDRADFLDVSECVYDWFGQCIFQRRSPGEVNDRPSDRSLWDHTGYGRWNLSWLLDPDQSLRFAISPTFFTRTGEERTRSDSNALDPLRAQRDMFKWINGVEHEANFFGRRLQNLAFGKAYLQVTQSQELVSGGVEVQRNVQRVFFGAGDALRYQLNDWAFVKASYEYAIRLPEPVELFGNGVQIVDNLLLEPERSHNANLTFLVDGSETRTGRWNGSLTGFYRGADNLIVLLGRDQVFRFENVYRARIVGVEAAASWLVPGNHVEFGANTTYQDIRNASGEGTFGQFEGDRIPNKPYFLVNGHLRLQERGLMTKQDELSLTWYSRYVHEFFRGWESVGVSAQKPTVATQLVHTAVLMYRLLGQGTEELSFSLEVQNLTDEKAFDFYGVQRPGRAFFAKTTAVF